MKKYEYFIIITLIILFNILYFFSHQKDKSINLTDPTDLLLYTTIHPRLYYYNEQGQLQYRINADKLEYNQTSASSFLILPIIYIHTKDKDGLWTIRSETGILEKKIELHLYNNVIMKQFMHQQLLHTATSSYAKILLDNYTMTSDKKITLTNETYHLSGIGFFSQLQQGNIYLLSEVEALYEIR